MTQKKALTSPENIEDLIFMIRGQRVLVDAYLADLYGVETRVLKQAVRRNRNRFPNDFMFELTKQENRSLTSQNVILEPGRYSKYLPFAFTEHDVAISKTSSITSILVLICYGIQPRVL